MNTKFITNEHPVFKYDFTKNSKPNWKFPNIFSHILFEYLDKIERLKTINNAIETGTHEGDTSICFSYLFDTVDTVEKYPENNPYTKNASLTVLHNEIKKNHPNINFCYGDSVEFMKNIFINNPNTDYFILLDAHVGPQTPVNAELECIKTYSKSKNHVIMIDDCNHIPVNLNKCLEINKDYKVVNTKIGNDIVLVY